MKTKWNLLVVFALVLALLSPAQTVYAEQAPVTYTFTAYPEPSGYEADVTFTLEAAGEYVDTNGTHYPPFGYVTFYDNGGAISDCSNVALNGGRNPQDGVYIPATCTVSMNTPGLHTITAYVSYEMGAWFASGTVTLQGGHTVSEPLPLTFTPDSLADFMYGANYGASIPVLISVSGGDGSYYFQYPVLNLPAGLQVETYNTNSAWVHGRPAELGTGYSFTMTVGDYNGYRSSKTYTFDVITNTPTINVFDRVYNAGDYDMDLLATMDYPSVTGLQPPSGTLAFSLDGVPVENCSAIQTANSNRFCPLYDTSGLTVGDHTITVVYTPDEAASPYYNSSTGTGTLTVNSGLGYIYGAFFVDADQDGVKDDGENYYNEHTWVVTLNQGCDSDPSNDRSTTIASDDSYFRFPDTPTGIRYCITVALPEGYTQTNTPDFTLSGESFFDVGVYWPQLTFSPAQLPSGTPNVEYNQTITISGGTGPYTISNVQTYLPAGVTFNQETLTVSGMATTASYGSVAFHAVDTMGLAGDFSSWFLFLLNGRFSLTSSANPSASGDPVTFTFTGEGDFADETGQNIPPSGPVDFYDGDIPIPDCEEVPLNIDPVSGDPAVLPAECTANELADGVHTIKAVFPEGWSSPYHGTELTLDQQVGEILTTYTIGGTLFEDLDSDGLKDTSEDPLVYWEVRLDQGCDGSSDSYVETDELGQFSFADLTAGLCYRLVANPYNSLDWTQTTTVGDITLDADKSFEIGLHYTGLVFTPEEFEPGHKNVEYNQTMTVSNGKVPYTFTINADTTIMPPGVDYTIEGDTITVSGTPTEAGIFGIEFYVEDSTGLGATTGSAIIIRGADATFSLTSALNPSVLGQEATFLLEAAGLDSGFGEIMPTGLVTFYADGVAIQGCMALPLTGDWVYDPDLGETVWVDTNPVECKTNALTVGEHAITADFIADPEGIYNDATGLTLEGGHTVVETGYTISGTAFNDPDLDGVMDEDEAGLAGVAVRFDAGCNGSVNLSVSTLADGSYSAVLPGGQCYRITAFAPSMKQTTPVEDILSADTSGVNVGLVELALAVNPASLPDGIAGELYNRTITVSGGTAPYIFNLDLNLPEGLEYAVDENAGTLTISGTPTAYGEAYVGGTVQDASGLSLDFGSSFYIKVKVNLAFNSAPNPSVLGETVIFSLGISDPGGGEVAGIIEFYDGAGDLAGCEETFPLDYGTTVVECSTASLAAGVHQIKATYDPLSSGSIYAHTEATLEHTVVAPVTITVGPETIPQGQVSVAYSQQFTASGGSEPYTFASTSTLPGGLSLSEQGLLSGTPTETGDFPITITATDANAVTGSGSYTLTIASAPPITLMPETLPEGTVGVEYFTQLSAAYGTGPYEFTLQAGALPNGLNLSSTGLLGGIPTEAGDFPLTITATDTQAATGSGSYTLTINPVPPITLMPETLPDSVVGVAYSAQLTASDGNEPYTFSIVGDLPNWLALSDQGLLSGTPDATGSWSFIIEVTDSSSPARTASREYTLGVTALTISGTTFTDTDRDGILDSGEAGLQFMEIYFDQDCDGTFDVWANSDTQGSYTSDPLTPNQTYCVNALQMPGFSRTSQPLTIESLTASMNGVNFGYVASPLTVTPGELPNGELNKDYNQTVTVSGGTGTYSFTPLSVQLPAGISYSFNESTGVFTISGKPGELGDASIWGIVRDANQDEAAIEIGFAIRAALTFTFTASPNPSNLGQAVTFSFEATAPSGNQYPDPVGEVTLYDVEPIDGCIGLQLGGSEGGTNSVTCTTSALGPGTHTITAQYYDTTGAYNDGFPTLTQEVISFFTTKYFMLPEPSLAGYPIVRTYVYFAGQGIQTDYSCTVDYGDGTVQTGRVEDRGGGEFICSDELTTNHIYQNPGSYTLTFRITNLISEEEIAPTIQHEVIADTDPGYITWSPTPVVENHSVTFTTSELADQYTWYLVSGPGIDLPMPIGMGQSFEFAFSSTGTYKVMLVAYSIDSGTGAMTSVVDGAEVEVIPPDSTPPTIEPTIQGTQGQNGWYTSDVNLSWTVTDNESEITSITDCDPISITNDQAATGYTCTATSEGGTSSETVNIKRDATAPSVTLTANRDPDVNGWYNHEIGFTASGSDATSGNASCGPISTYSGPDNATASVSGACTDNAGNEGNQTFSFQYDATNPIVAVTGVTEGSTYVQGNVPAAGCTTTDAIAGVLTYASVSVTGGDPDGTGDFTVTCSGALDNAGNAGDPVIVNYTVVSPSYYTFKIDVTTNGADGLTILVGAPITWQYVVTNVSSGNLTNIVVTDNILGQVCKINRLAPQASRTCTKTGVAVAGPYSNTGTATVISGGTTYTASDDSSYFGAAPAIDVEKLVSVDLGATWDDADSPTGPNAIVGDPVQFKFVITNTGNVDLSNITLSDTDLSLPACSTPAALAAASSYECVVEIPVDNGQHTNTATATGDYGGVTYTDSDNANYHGGNTIEPDIAINSLTITINKAHTTVSGQFVISDETEDGTVPDGFLVELTDYGLDWEAKAAKTNVFAPVVPSGGCTYSIVAIDYEQVAGWHSGDPITFDEAVTIGYTCTFSATQLPAGGMLRGTAWAYIFDQTDMEYTFIATKVIPK